MTVEEALHDLLKSREMGWTPGVEAFAVLRKYVDQVRAVTDDMANDPRVTEGSLIDYMDRLEDAQEGSDEYAQGA